LLPEVKDGFRAERMLMSRTRRVLSRKKERVSASLTRYVVNAHDRRIMSSSGQQRKKPAKNTVAGEESPAGSELGAAPGALLGVVFSQVAHGIPRAGFSANYRH
jgi:hypothetical protein